MWEVRRRRAQSGNHGAVLYVRGRGQVATTPPAAGANSEGASGG